MEWLGTSVGWGRAQAKQAAWAAGPRSFPQLCRNLTQMNSGGGGLVPSYVAPITHSQCERACDQPRRTNPISRYSSTHCPRECFDRCRADSHESPTARAWERTWIVESWTLPRGCPGGWVGGHAVQYLTQRSYSLGGVARLLAKGT